MPNSKRRTKQVKVQLIGEISIPNILDWLMAIYLVSVMGFVTLHLGGDRAQTMRECVLLMSGLVGLHTLWWLTCRPEQRLIDTKGLVFIPFLVYVALHWAYFSPVQWLAKGEFLLLVQAFLIFWVTLHNIRLRSQVWFLFIGLMAVAGVAVLHSYNQYFRFPDKLPMGLTTSPQYTGRASGVWGAPAQFAGLLLLVIFPIVIGAVVPRLSQVVRLFCAYVTLMFIFGLYLTFSCGAWIAFFATWIWVPFFAARTLRGRYYGSVATVLGSGVCAVGLYFSSSFLRERISTVIERGGEWNHFVMWHAAWGIFQQHPFLGSGLGSFRFLFDQFCASNGDLEPHYPHSEYLGVLADLGLIGMLLMLIPAAWIVCQALREWRVIADVVEKRKAKRIRRVPSVKMFIAGISLGLLAFAIHDVFEFHLKSPALLFWVAIYFAILAKCFPSRWISIPQHRGIVVLICASGALLAVGLPLFAVNYYQACAYAFEGERRVSAYADPYFKHRGDEAFVEESIGILQAAVESEPLHAEAWTWLSAMLAERAKFSPDEKFNIGNEAIFAAEAAIAIYSQDKIFWINYGNAVLLHGNRSQAEAAFKQAIAYAPMDSTPWFAYASLLSNLPERREEALVAVERALEIYPENVNAQNLRTKLLIP